MSHHIYHTRGLVVAKKSKGETDIYLKIFTYDLGMVLATAQGVQKLDSKNRFGLELYSIPELDLIKTKESFRVGAVRPEATPRPRAQTILRAKASALLQRFVIAEEPNQKLFNEILEILNNANNDSDIYLMICILNNLGYWSSDTFFDHAKKLEVNNKKQLVKQINEIVSQIHL